MSMTEKSFETKLGTIKYWISETGAKNAPELVFLPGITLHWIEDAGHNSNTDKPEKINGLIESFLENEVK